MAKTYRETFDDGPGGWIGWISNANGPKALEVRDSAILSRSPWWIDYNHAPPGAGYLHMLFFLITKGPFGEAFKDAGGPNRFVLGNYPLDFTNARITVRLRGELEERGAKLVLLIQATIDGVTAPWLLTAQPLRVTPEWSTQTLTLVPDLQQWTALGSRHDRGDMYGVVPLDRVLANVNCDIMLVMFPLDVVPMGPIDGDPHILRPEKDYPVWRSKLPEGYVWMDEISVEFA